MRLLRIPWSSVLAADSRPSAEPDQAWRRAVLHCKVIGRVGRARLRPCRQWSETRSAAIPRCCGSVRAAAPGSCPEVCGGWTRSKAGPGVVLTPAGRGPAWPGPASARGASEAGPNPSTRAARRRRQSLLHPRDWTSPLGRDSTARGSSRPTAAGRPSPRSRPHPRPRAGPDTGQRRRVPVPTGACAAPWDHSPRQNRTEPCKAGTRPWAFFPPGSWFDRAVDRSIAREHPLLGPGETVPLGHRREDLSCTAYCLE